MVIPWAFTSASRVTPNAACGSLHPCHGDGGAVAGEGKAEELARGIFRRAKGVGVEIPRGITHRAAAPCVEVLTQVRTAADDGGRAVVDEPAGPLALERGDFAQPLAGVAEATGLQGVAALREAARAAVSPAAKFSAFTKFMLKQAMRRPFFSQMTGSRARASVAPAPVAGSPARRRTSQPLTKAAGPASSAWLFPSVTASRP